MAAAGAGEILLTQRAHAAVDDQVLTEQPEELQLKGFTRPAVAVRAVGLRD